MKFNILSNNQIEDLTIKTLSNFTNVSCYLFGSYAKSKAIYSSDIDLLLIFDREEYGFSKVQEVQNLLKNSFKEVGKYCQPIYGYKENINEDSSILFRQYINYGQYICGPDISKDMNCETSQELKELEYKSYWKPMYLKKVKTIDTFVKSELDTGDSLLLWQYLFLAAYWYAKAELTLVDKQHSLNDFTLVYIYKELMKFSLSLEEENTLEYIQTKRDQYKSFEYIDADNTSFSEKYIVVKNLIKGW